MSSVAEAMENFLGRRKETQPDLHMWDRRKTEDDHSRTVERDRSRDRDSERDLERQRELAARKERERERERREERRRREEEKRLFEATAAAATLEYPTAVIAHPHGTVTVPVTYAIPAPDALAMAAAAYAATTGVAITPVHPGPTPVLTMPADSYKHQTPNHTIMIRCLAQHITENDIRQDILASGLMPKDIRLIRKKDSGASRGFAFVEFNTIHEATRWMELKQGVLILQDQYRAILQYSIPKDVQERNKPKQDWYCGKCGLTNFRRRDTCFKCQAQRQEGDQDGEGSDEVCAYPTHTLLFRGLDPFSTEEGVLQALQPMAADVPIRSVRIGRDPVTNTSRGICYLELNSVMDAMRLHKLLSEQSVVVDRKKVIVSFCKLPQLGVGASNALAAAQWSNTDPSQYTPEMIEQMAEYSASLYATTTEEHEQYLQYYREYFQNGGQMSDDTAGTQTDSVNAAAAVAQSAIRKAKAGKRPEQFSSSSSTTTSTTDTSSTSSTSQSNDPSTYPTPDVSTYQYDDSSGYYYDPSTGLYYDATSQYYYCQQTQQFMYWDAEKHQYLPAPTEGQEGDDKRAKKEDKQEKVKVAKKIAKDMERWAKIMNQKKEASKQTAAAVAANMQNQLPRSSGAADAGFAVLERTKAPSASSPVLMHYQKKDDEKKVKTQDEASSLVAAYGSDSEGEDDSRSQTTDRYTDWMKMACLLCKRQFPNKEALQRHQQLSDLHKKNLDKMSKSHSSSTLDSEEHSITYRDRAKERREKYGQPDSAHPNKLKEKYLKAREYAVASRYEEPTKAGIGSSNIGNKLLQKMGWSEGQGLGKKNQGRTQIVEAEGRLNTAGLGMKGTDYGIAPGDTYKDCVKKMMYARYQEIETESKNS